MGIKESCAAAWFEYGLCCWRRSISLRRNSFSCSIDCFSLRIAEQSFRAISSFVRRILLSSRDLFLSVRTLLHFSRQLAVQSDHHLIVFSIWAALARASSSSCCKNLTDEIYPEKYFHNAVWTSLASQSISKWLEEIDAESSSACMWLWLWTWFARSICCGWPCPAERRGGPPDKLAKTKLKITLKNECLKFKFTASNRSMWRRLGVRHSCSWL